MSVEILNFIHKFACIFIKNYFFFQLQLSHLVSALLSTLITTKDRGGLENDMAAQLQQGWPQLEHVNYAAQILKLALDKWATSVNQLRLQTHKALLAHLNDPKWSIISHHGALTALIALGPQVLEACVLPQMDRYLISLEEKMKEKNQILSNGHPLPPFPPGSLHGPRNKNKVYSLMWGTFLIAARSILYNAQDSKTTKTSIQQIYQMLSKHFGDTLCICPLPKVNLNIVPDYEPSGTRMRVRPLPSSSGNLAPRYPSELDDLFDDRFITPPHNGSALTDGAQALSNTVQRSFQCGNKSMTAQMNPFIKFNVRSMSARPYHELKRKRIGQDQMSYQHRKTFRGCIGKRLGHSLCKKRKQYPLLSCSLESIVL